MLSSNFLNIFAKSPIKPMQKHMGKVQKTVSKLEVFFNAVISKDWKKASKYHEEIMKLEADADEMKKEIRLHLPKSLFMAVDRGDLLSILTAQDKIASKAKHVTSIVLWRNMELPTAIVDNYKHFLMRCIEASKQAARAINELDKLIETGFRGNEVNIVADIIVELDNLERDTDSMQVELRKEMFKIEKDFDPIDVIFFYKIIDLTAELADQAQLVGHRFESLLAN